MLKEEKEVKLQGDKMGSCKNSEGEGFSDGATVKRQGVNLFGEDPTCPGATTAELKLLDLSSLELVLPKKGSNCRSPLATARKPRAQQGRYTQLPPKTSERRR